MRVGILNVTGYAGGELLRFLAGHPEFTLRGVTARSRAGQRLGDVWPWLQATARPEYADLILSADLDGSYDLVVSCLPHGASAGRLDAFLDAGVPAVDVSADFRLRDVALYQQWYGPHPAPEWLPHAVYGLTEFHRDELRQTKLVANPGCHAITAELALAPALQAGLIEPHVVVDSKTGISGAGRSAAEEFGYSEINESVNAYSVAAHRHGPEIAQELSHLAGTPVQVTFVPHLVPMTRGILVTAYGRLLDDVSSARVKSTYAEAYAGEPFVHIVAEPPRSKWTSGSNHAFVCAEVDEDNRTLVAMAVADNLGKGAAGAAVQNANVMLGLDEGTGLHIPASYP